MTIAEVWEKDRTVFSGFNADRWFRLYSALNREIPVDKIQDEPFYLKLTDNEKLCYEISLKELVEERKDRPWARYEVSLKDLD